MPPVGPEGSADRPYRENPPEHLKEVRWGGGGFMAGVDLIVSAGAGDTTNTVLLHGAKTWTEDKTLSGDLTIYQNRAGAYGNPFNTQTFVLGGQTTVFGGGPPGFHYNAWIETTTNGGKTWTRSYDAEQSAVVAIVWDKVKHVFYVQATANDTGTSGGVGGGEPYSWQVLRSPDGLSWELMETTPGGFGYSEYASPIMTAAADPIYKDGNNNNCPGGVYGYDKAKKILMAPYPDIVPFAYERRFGAPQIQIRREYDFGVRTFSYLDIPGMDTIISVAFAGGIWQAAGSLYPDQAVIATSTDDGEIWKVTYSQASRGSSAMVVVGASL